MILQRQKKSNRVKIVYPGKLSIKKKTTEKKGCILKVLENQENLPASTALYPAKMKLFCMSLQRGAHAVGGRPVISWGRKRVK